MAWSKMAKASKLDSTKAFRASLVYEPKDIVFGNPKLKVFLSHKGRIRCHGILGKKSVR